MNIETPFADMVRAHKHKMTMKQLGYKARIKKIGLLYWVISEKDYELNNILKEKLKCQ